MTWTLPLTIFTASLLGSVHCAGMCGTFALLAGGAGGSWRTSAAYNLGRLATYLAVGLLAGSVGATAQQTGQLIGYQRGASIVAGSTMALMGLWGLARLAGWRWAPSAPGAHAWIAAGSRLALTLPAAPRAALIGALTTLLPCGWLYAFAATAAGTARPLSGAGVMAVFWLGTLPMMATLGLGARRMLGPLAARLPVATSILLLIAGLATVAGRMALDPGRFTAAGDPTLGGFKPPCCEVDHGP